MDHNALKTLISTHPSWPNVDSETLMNWVNMETVNADKAELPNEEILSVILQNRAEFSALSDSDKQIVRDILYVGDSVPTASGSATRTALISIFGAGSNTIQTLAESISYQISRAQAVGIIGKVTIPDIEFSRTL